MTVVSHAPLGLRRMVPRDPEQRGRVASSLELFFDLTFVVAVSFAAEELLDFDRRDHVLQGAGLYIMVFFGIWWAWMNFSWFASAFDTDDWLYRITTIVQMAGVLVLAAGVPAAMEHLDFRLVVLGYVVMRLAMVSQWLRAAHVSEYRATARRYAGGIAALQLLWVVNLLTPSRFVIVSFTLLVLCELAIPIWAEQPRVTPFHPHHIAERYGLFTLIVLGEGLLSVTHAAILAVQQSTHLVALALVAASALVLIAGMWWIYFAREQHENLVSMVTTFGFGYLHYAIFAAAGAIAAGIEIALLQNGPHPPLPEVVGLATTTVPVALFLLGVWLLALRPTLDRSRNLAVLALSVAVGLCALVPFGITLAAMLVIAIVVLLELSPVPQADATEESVAS